MILKGSTNIKVDILFERSTDSRTRGNSLKLFKKVFRTNLYKYFFSNCVISLWNQLPQYVIEADNVNSFKNRLDNYWNVLGYGYT